MVQVILSILLLLCAVRGEAADRHVDNQSSCPGNGSSGTPYCTIQGAATVAVAGDRILIRGARTYIENVTPANSGNQSGETTNFITWIPWPGTGTPIWRGQHVSGTNTFALDLSNRRYHRVGPGFLFNNSTAWRVIQARDSSQSPTATNDLDLSNSTSFGHEILGNTFVNNGNQDPVQGFVISLRGAKDILIEGNQFQANYRVMVNMQRSGRITIRNNEIWDIKGAPPSFNPNILQAYAIWNADSPTFTGDPNHILGGYITVEDNHIHSTTSVNSGGIRCDAGGHHMTVRGNRVHGFPNGPGIFMESRCRNNIIEENLSYNNHHGYHSSGESIQTTENDIIRSNVFYGNAHYGIACRKERNTTFRNNIVANNGKAQWLTTETCVNNDQHDWFNNLTFLGSGTYIAVWDCELADVGPNDGRCMNALPWIDNYDINYATWTSNSGETGGVNANPLFVNPGAGDFHLQNTSPACGAGSGGVDIGAYPNADACGTPAPPTNLSIPGTIQAEEYRSGGEGVGYHDTTADNSFGAGDCDNGDDVDIKDVTSPVDEGCTIGDIASGEWWDYTVDIDNATQHQVTIRYARGAPSGDATIHLELNGNAITGAIALPPTGGWSTQDDLVVEGINLPAGEHVLRVFADTGGVDLNSMVWAEETPSESVTITQRAGRCSKVAYATEDYTPVTVLPGGVENGGSGACGIIAGTRVRFRARLDASGTAVERAYPLYSCTTGCTTGCAVVTETFNTHNIRLDADPSTINLSPTTIQLDASSAGTEAAGVVLRSGISIPSQLLDDSYFENVYILRSDTDATGPVNLCVYKGEGQPLDAYSSNAAGVLTFVAPRFFGGG